MINSQNHFLHSGQTDMHWEYFARQMWGNKFYGSVSYTDMNYWKKFYIRTLELWLNSFLVSVGSIDKIHHDEITTLVENTVETIKGMKKKDQIHSRLIACLFRLVFLLIGNQPSRAPSNRKRYPKTLALNSFRTMNYCQTIGQKCNLIKTEVLKNCTFYGFKDDFDFRKSYQVWLESKGLSKTDINLSLIHI